MIKYHLGHLGTKPDTLTHRSDIYPKGEDRAYAQANPQNFQPLFNPRQVLAAVMAVIHHQIQSELAHDSYAQEHLQQLKNNTGVNSGDEPFSLSDDKLLLRNKQIYVPDYDNLWLEILHTYHNHKLAGHPGIHKM